MKTKILFLSLITIAFVVQGQAQNRTRVNALNYEISDNLDLKAVASIFGESRNLQDFERRLNDPEFQISNLDLNNDNEVDYLRVIETVENRTHVIIIQSVLDRDVYQDVATIEVEKDRYNNVHLQVVGNEYMYGPNYIYEPVYYNTPLLYASFWSFNYRPYVSTWNWNFFPSYYLAWNPYPINRYRNNIQLCLNINNNYNYVNHRRSSRAVVLYNSRRSNGYERQYPDYNFSRRNATLSNRYELDQRRVTRNVGSRATADYSRNKTNSSREIAGRRTETQRVNAQNRGTVTRERTSQRTTTQRAYAQNRGTAARESAPQRTATQRDNTQDRSNASGESTPQRTATQRDDTQDRSNTSRERAPKRTTTQRDYAQNRGTAVKESAPQRTATQNRGNASRENASQRAEKQRGNSSKGNDRRS